MLVQLEIWQMYFAVTAPQFVGIIVAGARTAVINQNDKLFLINKP